MSDRILRQIVARMSLRAPQERSLDILAAVLGMVDVPSADLSAALEAVGGWPRATFNASTISSAISHRCALRSQLASARRG
jgi:hypothetical protein